MKLHYCAETDSLSIELKAGASVETLELRPGLNVDLDANGDVIGFDIDGGVPCPESVDFGDGSPDDAGGVSLWTRLIDGAYRYSVEPN